MNGEERRNRIVEEIEKSSPKPLSGSALAKILGVSRQVIVQDVALLRAENKEIIATNKGYVKASAELAEDGCREVLAVKHTNEQILDELNTIVDNGGRVCDVTVSHDVYGEIAGDLQISSRRDAARFVEKMNTQEVRPLKELTKDVHYHTVETQTQEEMDVIKKELHEKGYLIVR